MKLHFLGTGAADWNGRDERGELRRNTSTLIDESLLIDVTGGVLEMIEDAKKVTDVFFTHSHNDHCDIEALKKLAPCRVYAHESWAHHIQGEGLEVRGVKIGEEIKLPSGHTVIPMPSNHHTWIEGEACTLHYLIETEDKRLLYATDGAWLTSREHEIIGDKALTSVVFDATIGDGHEGDYRIFGHNSIDMIRLMLKTMNKTGRLPVGAPVYLTHLARTLHGTQAEIEASLEKPFVACYDGLKVEI